MIIRINQIAVDFTLEKEQTMADLTRALRSWAQGQNLAILGILADGRALGPEDATPLACLNEIEVEAVPSGERDLARVDVISRFFALLAQGWTTGDGALTTELHLEYPAVRGALFPLLAPLAHRLKDVLEILDGPWTDPPVLAAAALRMAREIESRRKELQNPAQALVETLADLERTRETLSDLGLLFQRGQDREAFDRILGLFTLLEDGGRRAGLYWRDHGGESEAWSNFDQELKPFLRETEEALVAGDYILLTDLLEYEISPRILRMKELFPELSNLDPVSEVL